MSVDEGHTKCLEGPGSGPAACCTPLSLDQFCVYYIVYTVVYILKNLI